MQWEKNLNRTADQEDNVTGTATPSLQTSQSKEIKLMGFTLTEKDFTAPQQIETSLYLFKLAQIIW